MKNDQHNLKSKVDFCLKELGLSAQVLKQNEDRTVTFSALFNSEGLEVSAGSGNGHCSEEKSWAECIEHFFFLNGRFEASNVQIKEVRQQEGFQKDGFLTGFHEDQMISAISFQCLNNHRSQIMVPLGYVSRQALPASEPDLKKFCSSSGYSFHQSREEAFLHGLLEVAERHEFSNLLLGRQQALQISRESLRAELKTAVAGLEEKYNGEIRIFVIQPHFAAWTSFAVFYPNDSVFPIPQTAQKARMNLNQSVMGSISELSQILNLYSEDERQEDLSVLGQSSLKDHPAIHLKWLRQLPIVQMSSFSVDETVRDDLQVLIQSIQQKGFQAFGREVYRFRNDCSVAQVFVPGFEKYNLIRLGVQIPTHQKV